MCSNVNFYVYFYFKEQFGFTSTSGRIILKDSFNSRFLWWARFWRTEIVLCVLFLLLSNTLLFGNFLLFILFMLFVLRIFFVLLKNTLLNKQTIELSADLGNLKNFPNLERLSKRE